MSAIVRATGVTSLQLKLLAKKGNINNGLTRIKKKYEELGKEIERFEKQEKQDCIYLLSIEEYEKYKDKIPKFSCWWWLRSPGLDQNYAVFVYLYGAINNFGNYVNNVNLCVRPVLNISNLKSFNRHHTFIDNDTLVHCGITWKRIDTDLFIAEVPIATHRFDAISNDYQTSEVRQFLLDWYEERKNWQYKN